MHDPRIGRFFAVDPLASEYSHNSPYAFSENYVIDHFELEGLEGNYYAKQYEDDEGDTQIEIIAYYDFGKDASNRYFVLDEDATKDTPNRKEHKGNYYEIQPMPEALYTQEQLDDEMSVWPQQDKDGYVYIYQGGDYTDEGFLSRLWKQNMTDGNIIIAAEAILPVILPPVLKGAPVAKSLSSFDDLWSKAKVFKSSKKSIIKESSGSASKSFDDLVKGGGKVDKLSNGAKKFTPDDGSGIVTLRKSTGGDGRATISKSAKDAGGNKIQHKIRFDKD